MTETSTAATIATAEDFKFGTVGRPFPGCEVKIAEDGEILVKGPNIFQGYYKNPEATARDPRRRLASHRRHRRDRLRRLHQDHRPQEGHHHHRRRQEHHPRQPRGRDQAAPARLPVRRDRRPPAVPGRARHPRPRGGRRVRRERGLPTDPEALASNDQIRAAHRGARREDQLEVRPCRAGEEDRDPPARPLPGGRRAHADDEGEAQRRHRQVRRRDRRPLRQLSRPTPEQPARALYPASSSSASRWRSLRSSTAVVCSRTRRQADCGSCSRSTWSRTWRTRRAEISIPWRSAIDL